MLSAPSASRIPPTVDAVAKTIDRTGTSTGDAVTRMAAAAGVQITDRTSSAPTTCTDIATVSPRTSMNSGESKRTGTPRAAADSGSVLANVSGRHITAMATSTTTETPRSALSWTVSTATTWPSSAPNLLTDRPRYRLRNNTPRPSPNG